MQSAVVTPAAASATTADVAVAIISERNCPARPDHGEPREGDLRHRGRENRVAKGDEIEPPDAARATSRRAVLVSESVESFRSLARYLGGERPFAYAGHVGLFATPTRRWMDSCVSASNSPRRNRQPMSMASIAWRSYLLAAVHR
jgi:hypothetical protein